MHTQLKKNICDFFNVIFNIRKTVGIIFGRVETDEFITRSGFQKGNSRLALVLLTTLREGQDRTLY